MIDTLYHADALGHPAAHLLALLIGLLFGFALERGGFGSSRRLAGIFYFRDMTVLKVMFTAVIFTMLAVTWLVGFGILRGDTLYMLPTQYGAQLLGGLIFGAGFVIGGWCPGTAAVGAASGKYDALLFLGGAGIGSWIYNYAYPALKGIESWGARGTLFAHESLGIPRALFTLLFTLVAVAAFHGSEWLERKRTGGGVYLGSRFLAILSVLLVVGALGAFAVPEAAFRGGPASASPEAAPPAAAPPLDGREFLAALERGDDHIDPADLAERLLSGAPTVLVDIRPADEFAAFHLRGAVNIPTPELLDRMGEYAGRGMVVLYSNGMTHPAQARDLLVAAGAGDVRILTDGLQGFLETCLTPVSLRREPLPAAQAARVNAWRAHFLGVPALPGGNASPAAAKTAAPDVPVLRAAPGTAAEPVWPGLVEAPWLAKRLSAPDLKIVDLRPQPEYNAGHVPGARSLQVESLRGLVGGVPSMLLPADLLARQAGLLGLAPGDRVVLIHGDKPHDATLAATALERLGHARFGILDGGHAAWKEAGLPLSRDLPAVTPTDYPVPAAPDPFTVDSAAVLAHLKSGGVILDVRPAEYHAGTKSDEARAGRIPGSLNRPHTADVAQGAVPRLLPADELARAYGALLPDKKAAVIVHCRTGHQASQARFILKYLLKYENVRWYDAGFTEWAARSDLPVEGPAR